MEKLLENLYSWHIFNEEKKLNFNGLYLRPASDWILVDPPPMSAEDAAFIEKTGKPKRIYLTNKHHTRASLDYRQKWGSRISVHEKDQPIMEIMVDETFSDADRLEGALQVIRVPHAKTPGESALYWANNKTMIVGDAVIGKPAGDLSMLPDEKFKEPALARKGPAVLLEYPFDRLLVGDGTSIPQNARSILKQFLSQSSKGT